MSKVFCHKGYWFRIFKNGRIQHKSAHGFKYLTPHINKRGYLVVSPRKGDARKKFYLHRLLALVYLSNPNGYDQVCHNDGNPLNNNINNLRWDTHIGNQRDRVKHGTSNRGSQCAASKLTTAEVQNIRQMPIGIPQRKLAKDYGVSQVTIHDILRHKTWRHI